MRSCERCGGEVSWTHDTTVLVGGVHAHLCTTCLRDHNDLCLTSGLAARDHEIGAKEACLIGLAAAQQVVSEADWRGLYADKLAILEDYAALSREFVSQKIGAKS